VVAVAMEASAAVGAHHDLSPRAATTATTATTTADNATTTGDTKLRGRAELRAVHVSEEAPKQPRLAILLLMKVAAFA